MFNMIANLGAIFLPLIGAFLIGRFIVRRLRDLTSFKFQAYFYATLLIGLLGLLIFWGQHLEFEKRDLETIEGILKDDPAFRKGTKGRGYLELRIKGQRCRFQTNDFSYHVLRKNELERDVKGGDSVFISIGRISEMSVIDRLNYNNGLLDILELWTTKQKYISIEDYNRYRKEDYPFAYVFLLLPTTGLYVYWFVKRRKGEHPWVNKGEVKK